MNYFGNGTTQNSTRFYEYMGNSLNYEPNLYTPVVLLKAYTWLENLTYDEVFNLASTYGLSFIQNNSLMILCIIFYVIFYLGFITSLHFQ